MGRSPKEDKMSRAQVQMTKQRNLHHPVGHEDFSHLLTPINWWSS